jgi:hypothetical protein
VRVNEAVLPEQIVLPAETLAVGLGLTTIDIEFEDEGDPDKHGLALGVIVHVITSPITNELEEYIKAVSPDMMTPFLIHWYEGEMPPFVGVTVNVTEVPEQIVVALAAIDTLALRTGLTVTVAFALKFCEQVVVVFVTETNVNV